MTLLENTRRQRNTYWSCGEEVRSACEDSTTINQKKSLVIAKERAFWAVTKMHTFCKGKSPTSTAAELAGLRLLFLREITEKVAARLKLFKKNQCLCNYGGEMRWLFGLGSVKTEPSSTDQQVRHRLLFLPEPGSKVAPQGWIFPQVSPGPGGVLVSWVHCSGDTPRMEKGL